MKTDLKTTTGLVTKAPFELAQLPKEVAMRVHAARAVLSTIGRRSLEDTFEAAAQITAIRDAAPEAPLPKLLEGVVDYTRRHVDNLLRVQSALGPRRDELVELGLTPTVCFALAYAPEDKVEAVVEAYRSGRTLKVREVKAMVAPPKAEAEAPDPADVAGPKGLRALALAKVRQDEASFFAHLEAIRDEFRRALDQTPPGRRFEKGKLVEAVMPTARRASNDLVDLVEPIDRDTFAAHQFYHRPFRTGRWGKLCELVDRLGRDGGWPEAEGLREWVETTAVPLIEFGLDGRSKPKAAAPVSPQAVKAARAGTSAAAAAAPPTETPVSASSERQPPEVPPKPVRKARSAASGRKAATRSAPAAAPGRLSSRDAGFAAEISRILSADFADGFGSRGGTDAG